MNNPLLTLGHSLLNRRNQDPRGEKPCRLGTIPEQLVLIPGLKPPPPPPGSHEEDPLLLCREGRPRHFSELPRL